MGTFTLILSLVFIGLYIALFVKLWIMTNDVDLIKKSLSENNTGEFSEIFYSYILSDQIEMAKKVLFDEISKDQDYKGIFSAKSKIYLQERSDILNKRYDIYLRELNIENIDFTRISKL